MSSAVKWIIIVVVAVIVILLIVPFLIPVNKFRPEIEQKASEALGRKVQLGDMSLSILSGSLGVDNLSVSDDPKFSSSPFLTAKSVKVGVELMPLIFSKQLNVTEIKVVEPQVTLLKDPAGKWNYSSLGGSSNASAARTSQNPPASSQGQAFSVGKLSLENGQITVGNTNSKKRSVYTNVDMTASDVALDKNFPFSLSASLPGGGSLKLEGKAGPEDMKDASLTPLEAKLTVNNLDLAKTGMLDPSLGLAGLADVDANLASAGGKATVKGQAKLSKAILIAGGSPSSVPAVVNFATVYNLETSSGELNPSTLAIANAKTKINGTYKSVGDEFSVDMRVVGEGLPATDLESFLPALAINVPAGSKLSAGTMNANLHITGPTNKLVTDGNLGLFNGVLSNFDLGKRMSEVASLAGIKTGKDLQIEKFTTDVHMAPTGLDAKNIDLVVPTMGTVVGGGTVDSKNQLDFKLVASVSPEAAGSMGGAAGAATGQLGKLTGGGTSCKNGGMKVPLQVRGTTADPKFVPDVGGAAAGLLKSELGCAGGSLGGLTNGLTGQGQNQNNPIGALGGLLGNKPKP